MEAYGALADIYDVMMQDDFDYPKWAEYYWALLEHANVRPKAILETGCGTGLLTAALSNFGAKVTGVDISESMLRRAAERLRAAGVQAMLIRQDMCALIVPRPVDAVICGCDGVNCLLTEARVLSFFQSAFRALRPGGALAFDISSRHKLETLLGNAFFGAEQENIAYLWENSVEDHLVTMDITFFVREEDGRYRRFQEAHEQRAHSIEEITSLLEHAGFLNIEIFGDQTFAPPKQEEERIHFLARRSE